MKELLEANAAKIGELRAAIYRTFAHRSEGEAGWKAWHDACNEMGESYDELAFPGGLTRAFELLKGGDLEIAEFALLYCELRPYYFRSGYHRSRFIRLLKKLPLPEPQAQRFKKIVDEVHRRKMESKARYAEYWARRIDERKGNSGDQSGNAPSE